jgi:hypothetical protein
VRFGQARQLVAWKWDKQVHGWPIRTQCAVQLPDGLVLPAGYLVGLLTCHAHNKQAEWEMDILQLPGRPATAFMWYADAERIILGYCCQWLPYDGRPIVRQAAEQGALFGKEVAAA